MGIAYGATDLAAIKYGATDIAKVYKGTEEIWAPGGGGGGEGDLPAGFTRIPVDDVANVANRFEYTNYGTVEVITDAGGRTCLSLTDGLLDFRYTPVNFAGSLPVTIRWDVSFLPDDSRYHYFCAFSLQTPVASSGWDWQDSVMLAQYSPKFTDDLTYTRLYDSTGNTTLPDLSPPPERWETLELSALANGDVRFRRLHDEVVIQEQTRARGLVSIPESYWGLRLQGAEASATYTNINRASNFGYKIG